MESIKLSCNLKKGGAFTLVELLVVVVVFGLLMRLTIMAVASVQGGRNLTAATSVVVEQINMARQSAMSRSTMVRWKIASVSDPDGRSGPAFRQTLLEIFDPEQRGWKPLSRRHLFPNLIVAQIGDSSTLLSEIGPQAVNEVVFLADGTMQLDPAEIWTLTVIHSERPSNYMTIQLDPVTGRTRLFHP